ncbi:transcription factor A, mitochondrial-like [Exaiptasia diaphana]|uniref:HMG box domain-containing protein n=1 Tax=Exaiptasia diaphana TaxID=2652724 RepID=A0A913WQK3_EXADI|nr:transcription factor A, mitochondrial-like [Exaiptasia diaphana]
MNFISISRALLCSFSRNQLCPSIVLAEKLSKLGFSTSSQQNAEENSSRYKRPIQPYLRFRSEFITKFKKESPDLKLQELNHLISEEWSQLDPEIKAEYRRTYDEEMAEFKAPFEKMPRKPAGVYARFVKENFAKVRDQNPELNTQEVIGKLSEEWKKVSVEEKDRIKKKVMVDVEQYHSDVVAFQGKLTEDEIDFLNHFAKDQMKKLNQERLKLLNFPKKPGGTFIVFVNMEKENFPREEDESMSEWLKRMGRKWRNMSSEEKEMYFSVKKRAMEKYEEDVENWKLEQQAKILEQ